MMANYNFVPHFLAPLKKQRLLKNIAVFDIETDEWADDTYTMSKGERETWNNRRITPFLAMFFNGKDMKFYEGQECIQEFLKDYLKFSNRTTVTFAHNGGKFDFLALYETLIRDPYLSERFYPKPFLAHGRLIALTIKDNDKHVWHFRDSYSLLPGSLQSLCYSFKPEHRKLTRPKAPYAQASQEWQSYGENDCRSLYEILQLFNGIIADVGGSVGYTIASTAMLTFRKKFLDREIPNYFPYNNLFRNAYYGGRVEIIRMLAQEKGTPYYYYDVNSEYPDVMANHPYPVSMPLNVRYKDADECRGKCGIMECSIIAPPDLDIPLLPYRHPDTRKLLFPLGRWYGWYEYSLIEAALKYGYEIKPHRCYEFQSEYIFREYVKRFYNLKCHSEGAERQTMKLLLNALYGKFGEHQEREEMITDPDTDITGSYPYDDIFGYSIRKIIRFSAYHLPAIAARVTSLAQLKLYGYIEQIQRLGGKIYYMDTDSIVTDIRIPTSTELGGLKLEHEIQSAVFLAPKTYCLKLYNTDETGNNEKIVMKGFSRSFHKHLCYHDFEAALLTGDFSKFLEYIVEPASLKTVHIRKMDGFVTVLNMKAIRTGYDKRIINPDYTTTPFIMPLPEPIPEPVPLETLTISHHDYSAREKQRRARSPQGFPEKQLLERLIKQTGRPRDYLMRCITACRDSDFDLESEIDWEQGGDPLEQIEHRLKKGYLDYYL
jgi:hypothetical protein